VQHHRITRRLILDEGRRLRVYFDDAMVRDIDLIAESRRGPAFRALRDPAYVRGVQRIWDGYLLEWPDRTTWSAEALRTTGVQIRPAEPTSRRKQDSTRHAA